MPDILSQILQMAKETPAYREMGEYSSKPEWQYPERHSEMVGRMIFGRPPKEDPLTNPFEDPFAEPAEVELEPDPFANPVPAGQLEEDPFADPFAESARRDPPRFHGYNMGRKGHFTEDDRYDMFPREYPSFNEYDALFAGSGILGGMFPSIDKKRFFREPGPRSFGPGIQDHPLSNLMSPESGQQQMPPANVGPARQDGNLTEDFGWLIKAILGR